MAKIDETRPYPRVATNTLQLFIIASDIITLFMKMNTRNKALITKYIC